MWFSSYASRQTNGQTYRHARHNTSHSSVRRRSKSEKARVDGRKGRGRFGGRVGEDGVFALVVGGVHDDETSVDGATQQQVAAEPGVADEVREVGLLHGVLAQHAVRVAVHKLLNIGKLDTVVLLIGSIVISLSRCCLPNDEGQPPQ